MRGVIDSRNVNKREPGGGGDRQEGIIASPVRLTDLLGNRGGDLARFLELQQLGQGGRRDGAEIK